MASYTLAITGKGGVGKTTLAALLVARMIARGCRPVLAIDADPNTCLDAALGVHAGETIGGIREQARQIAGKGMAGGIATRQLLEMKIAQSLVEAEDFDLIAMGRPEGPGCYCYANDVLRQTISAITENYPYLVLDNEAGLENVSRRIVTEVDVMIVVSDPSQRGLVTLRRLHDLAREMGVKYKKLVLAVNRLRSPELPAGLELLCRDTGADHLLAIPDDPEVARFGEEGRSLRQLPQDNPVVVRVDALLDDVKLSAIGYSRSGQSVSS